MNQLSKTWDIANSRLQLPVGGLAFLWCHHTLTALVAIPGLARVFHAGLGFLLRMLQTWIEFWGPASCHVYEPALHESSKRFRAIF